MPSSGSTSTADLYAVPDMLPSTDTSPVSSSRNITPRTHRLIERLKLDHPPSKVMKSRPLQRKQGQKRNLATAQTASAANKRVQTRQGIPGRNQPQGAGNPTEQDHIEGPQTHDVDDESIRQENHQTRQTTRRTTDEADSSRVINTIRPNNRPSSSSMPSHDTQLTREVLIEMFKASEKRILEHIVSQQRVFLERLETVERVVKDLPSSISAVKTGVADVKVMLLPSGKKSGSQRTINRPRNLTKVAKLHDEVVAANPTLLAELHIVFETDVACVAAAKALALQMTRFHGKRDTVSVSSRAMHVFLYSYKKEMGKSATKDGIGSRHSDFRFKVAKTMLQLARTCPDHLSSTHALESISEGTQTPDVQNEGKPSWLTSDLVDIGFLTLARKHHEWFVSDLPKDPTEPLKRKALYIAKRFFKVTVDMLNQSRQMSKSKMYEDGFYCLLNWESLTWFPKELHNPILTFAFPEEEAISPSLVAECAVGDLNDVRATNAGLMQSLISERKEMILEATYDVIVSKEATALGRKKDEQKEQRTLTRIVNILRMSKSFLCGFCHLSEEDLLRSHPAMLRCVYRFALVIRDIFIRHSPPSKRCVKPPKSRRAGQASAQQTSQQDVQPGRPSSRRHSQSGTNRTETDSSVHPISSGARATSAGTNEDQQILQRDSPNSNTRPINTDRRKETPPIELETLFPAESEMDRVLENHVQLSMETYDRINVTREAVRHENDGVPQNQDESDVAEGVEYSDSEDDGMSDMMRDDD